MATSGQYDNGAFRIQLAATGVAAADLASVLNPAGEDLIITKCIVNLTHESTGAATIDVGVGSSASTLYDNLIDGLSAATAGTFSDVGTNGKTGKLWTSGHYLTASEASGDTTGLVGELIVKWIPRTSAGAAT